MLTLFSPWRPVRRIALADTLDVELVVRLAKRYGRDAAANLEKLLSVRK